jgi:hypothetical protein
MSLAGTGGFVPCALDHNGAPVNERLSRLRDAGSAAILWAWRWASTEERGIASAAVHDEPALPFERQFVRAGMPPRGPDHAQGDRG